MVSFHNGTIDAQTDLEFNSLQDGKGGWNRVEIRLTMGKVEIVANGNSITMLTLDAPFRNFAIDDRSSLLVDARIAVNGNGRYEVSYDNRATFVDFWGFATCFDNWPSLEELFQVLEESKDLEELLSIYNMLFQLHRVHKFDCERFWHRLFVAMKKLSESLEDNFLLFFHQIPFSMYGTTLRGRFLNTVLKDIELCFSFDPKILSSFFKLIVLDIGHYVRDLDGNLATFLIHVMKTGIGDAICFDLIPIIHQVLLCRKETACRFLPVPRLSLGCLARARGSRSEAANGPAGPEVRATLREHVP
jgi:hypothetical protein